MKLFVGRLKAMLDSLLFNAQDPKHLAGGATTSIYPNLQREPKPSPSQPAGWQFHRMHCNAAHRKSLLYAVV